MSVHYLQKNTLKGFISHILVDLITHNYELIEPAIELDGIRMLSKPDIAAMKVNAIAGNGTRVKDFISVIFDTSFARAWLFTQIFPSSKFPFIHLFY